MNSSNQSGFTLIELMIVVIIVAILAAIAFGDYSGYVLKARRADGRAALVGLATAMERHFTERASYNGSRDGNNRPTMFSDKSPLEGTDRYYDLRITTLNTTSYVLQAIPTGQQANDPCGTLTLDQTGAKGIDEAHTGMTVDLCWH